MSVQAANECGTLALGEQASALVLMLEKEFQAPVAVFDGVGGARIIQCDTPGLPSHALSAECLKRCREHRSAAIVIQDGDHDVQIAMPFFEGGQLKLIAVVCFSRLARSAAESVQENHRLQKLCQLAAEKLTAPSRKTNTGPTPREVQAYSVLTAMDALLRAGLHGDRPLFQRRILKAIGEVLNAETVAWLPREAGVTAVVRGTLELSAWNCQQLAGALTHRAEWDNAGVLIDNNVSASNAASLLPGVSRLLALKVNALEIKGYLVAINKRARADDGTAASREPETFRRSDAAFLAPFSALLAAQSDTTDRHTELEDLLVGFARSLTAAIDAKDPYTAGHSERVARIAVELSKELGLSDAETRDIYLAGLLHDIGKVGVRDDILRKEGKLTEEERAHVAQHPEIGYRILSGLSAIKHLLGGVLYHHEQIDGGGYPAGLAGDNIPQNARIIAVADSFDAMSTDRPYRAGMPAEKVQHIFREGAGKQWDPAVIEAFFRCEETVRTIRQSGIGDSLRDALHGALQPVPQYEGSFVMPRPNPALQSPA